MNSLIRWSLTLGILISPLSHLSIIHPTPVVALPQGEIIEFLSGVPVYSLLDRQGLPIGRQLEDGSIITPVFMSRREAQAFLRELTEIDSQTANSYRIQILPLSRIYEIARETSTASTRLFLDYIPSGTELQRARELVQQKGQKYPGDVPLYVAKIESDQSYLTIKQEDEEVVPIFFEKATIDRWIATVTQTRPELGQDVSINVISLSSLIANLENNDNALLRSLRFWPSQEMMKIIRSNTENQNQ
ncbi:Tic22 family protein [Cyanothece sp. BG0011]|uniref:Tic22 family protein n=1 Tax=Cyanothece sp. BG0011 TaxID=2082950 RepID=UPI000D1E6DEA|nr:Tic22 family protein [Cyanothece sp. BG0011]